MGSLSKVPASVWLLAEEAYKVGGTAASRSILFDHGYELAGSSIRTHMGAKGITFDLDVAKSILEESYRTESVPPPTTRRCKNKDCIHRFVPVNDQHFFHESACRNSDNLYTTEEILEEEGQLYPEGNHLEIAKRAFGQKNLALRKVSQLQSLREYLGWEVHDVFTSMPEKRIPAIPSPILIYGKGDESKGEREIIVQLGDWQIGKLEDGIGVDVMIDQRIPRIKEAMTEIVQRQRDAGFTVNKMHVSFGGDMLEGCQIYAGQNVTGLDRTSNTHRIIRQIAVAADLESEIVTHAATLVDLVEVDAVPGNHGRTNGKNDFADPEDNFDLMISMWAKDKCANTPRITWNIHENWWGGFNTFGHYVVSTHGDSWRGAFHEIENLLPKWVINDVFGARPDLVLTHHRHEFRATQVGGIPILQGGTIDGGSKWYLKAYGKSSPPSQSIIVSSPRRCIESVWPLDFRP